MKMNVLLFALLVGVGLTAVAAIEVKDEGIPSISDIVGHCSGKDACPETLIYCAGYNTEDAEEDDKCNRGVSTETCEFAFATFRKIKKDDFYIQLVAKISQPNVGVGLRFITESDSVKTSGEHGVNCHLDPDGKYHIDRFQANPLKGKSGLEYRNEEDDEIFIHNGTMGKASDQEGWIICQFVFELSEHAYKLQFLKVTAEAAPSETDPENFSFKVELQAYSHDQLFFMGVLQPCGADGTKKCHEDLSSVGGPGGGNTSGSSRARLEAGGVIILAVSIFMVKKSLS